MHPALEEEINCITREIISRLAASKIDLSSVDGEKIVGFLPRGKYKGIQGSILVTVGKYRYRVKVLKNKKGS